MRQVLPAGADHQKEGVEDSNRAEDEMLSVVEKLSRFLGDGPIDEENGDLSSRAFPSQRTKERIGLSEFLADADGNVVWEDQFVDLLAELRW